MRLLSSKTARAHPPELLTTVSLSGFASTQVSLPHPERLPESQRQDSPVNPSVCFRVRPSTPPPDDSVKKKIVSRIIGGWRRIGASAPAAATRFRPGSGREDASRPRRHSDDQKRCWNMGTPGSSARLHSDTGTGSERQSGMSEGGGDSRGSSRSDWFASLMHN